MLENKIRKKRQKLNDYIANDEDYEKIYKLSVELDELIAEYYKEEKKKTRKEKNNKPPIILK